MRDRPVCTRSLPSLCPGGEGRIGLRRESALARSGQAAAPDFSGGYSDLSKASQAVLKANRDKLPRIWPPQGQSVGRKQGRAEAETWSDKRNQERLYREAANRGAFPDGSGRASPMMSQRAASTSRSDGAGDTIENRWKKQQLALDADRKFVQQTLAKIAELPSERAEREQVIDDHIWTAVFAPTPLCHDLLPLVFRRQISKLLQHPQCPPPTAPGKVLSTLNSSMDLRMSTRLNAQKHDESFSSEEVLEVVRLCSRFQALTSQMEGAPQVLTRPAFCRFVCAMGGLSHFPGGRTWLKRAVKRFDEFAEAHKVRGTPSPGGAVMGYLLTESRSLLQELPISEMVKSLLRDMQAEIANHRKLTHHGALEAVRHQFFERLMTDAMQYVNSRARFVDGQIDRSGPARSPMPPPAAPPAAAEAGAGAEEQSEAEREASGLKQDNQQRNSALYAHTFAVLKGELLMNQMLEPEVLHFIAQFSGLFGTLFQAYRDVPTGDPQDGHMTLYAFLRFCGDFGLFPAMADFQTLKWLYESAEGCIRVEPREKIRSREKGDHHREKRPEHSRASSFQEKRRPSLVKRKKKSSKENVQDTRILFYGKWLSVHLRWLMKDHGEMDMLEFKAAELLAAMYAWLEESRLSVRDLFQLLVDSGEDSIDAKLFQAGVDFMNLDYAPDPEEMRGIIKLLSPSGQCDEPIELETLQMAIRAIQKRLEKLDSAANCFTKETWRLSKHECEAKNFFREMAIVVERLGKTAEELFSDCDKDGSGDLTAEELTKQLQSLLKNMDKKSPALDCKNPFHLFDLNEDGTVSCQEFCTVMDKVKSARKAVKSAKHPIFLSASSEHLTKVAHERIFGRRAFIECLLKVAFVHLGYHGTAVQAEQPSFAKALWLIVHLHRHFDEAKTKASTSRKSVHRQSNPAVQEEGSAKYTPPLQRLAKRYPRLFLDAPTEPPAMELPAWATLPEDSACYACGATAQHGWGNAGCGECCQADAILETFLRREDYADLGPSRMDSVLLGVAVGC